MASGVRTGVALAGAGVAAMLLSGAAHAASEVHAGGYLDQAMAMTRQDLAEASASLGAPVSVGSFRISVAAGESSAVTGFTPRFAGLGSSLDTSRVFEPDYGSLLKTRLGMEESEPTRRGLRVGPDQGAEIAGLEIGWSAIAEVEERDETIPDATSAFVVGGEMAISGLRLDAAYGQEPGLLGLDGSRMTAGVGYDFGSLNTRISYSLVEDEAATVETSLVTVGSQLTLRPGLVVEGDLAYAEDQDDVVTTAGRVSLRLNF